MKIKCFISLAFVLVGINGYAQQQLKINDDGYFEMPGLNVTSFSDIYPDGHQTGVTIIQHGVRVAANGDLRLEASPGQWSPVPKGGNHSVDIENQLLKQQLWYPDSSKNRKGFNPIIYPDLSFKYEVIVKALEGNSFKIIVNLDEALPKHWIGKVGFNFELFPGEYFGQSFMMDHQFGQFPIQPNGPIYNEDKEWLTTPMAKGKKLVIAPGNEYRKITIESNENLSLIDGRINHNNGWFIVRSLVPEGATQNAIEWTVTPNVVKNWRYEPVIQISQLGYHKNQEKRAIIEFDKSDDLSGDIVLYQITDEGKKIVKTDQPEKWGNFLRYQYGIFDFSEITTEGLYLITFRNKKTHIFKISNDAYSRHVWQPTLEYYLPVQMCHMRINEKYRVWHDYCHLDDAVMAKTNINHFDGYVQGHSTLTDFKSMDPVPQLNEGGWHDAGDYDLRIESQIGTIWMLSLMIEEFGLDYDATMIDPSKRLVEIHQPDGKSDAIQQIEHGLASVLGAYRAMGRLYRGIICPTIRQYVMLGDAASMTDNLIYDPNLDSTTVTASQSGIPDDRTVFTEENPRRELYVAAGLAAAFRVLKSSNPALARECIQTALALYDGAHDKENTGSAQILALSELILATDSAAFKTAFVGLKKEIISNIGNTGWAVGHVIHTINDKTFLDEIADAVDTYQKDLKAQQQIDSPYGVPYKPNIWGAGWNIQRFGVEQYFFHKGWPGLTTTDFYENSLHFILGVHPGENTSSFASGVGAKSVTVAYGVNRVDWSFIPGGVASGTALIRPDLPELKIWPFFWQQTEYVMGGGATNFMFLVMAVDKLYKNQ